ncbi:MAG: NAD(+)/NADH kinase [Desulfobacterales bacterium]|jgi:NAD+ kinase
MEHRDKVKTIGLIVKPVPEAQQTADRLETWFQTRRIGVARINPPLSENATCGDERSQDPAGLSCLFVLGGDGTLLSAVRWIGDIPLPILGVKFGQVGFLAEIAADDLFGAADAVLQSNFAIQKRMRLTVSIFKDMQERCREIVLNDVVVTKSTLARLAHVEVSIDNHYLTTFSADGLIVATPTGSTAYSLAAGGPVIHPEVPGIIMTPICPFTLTNRPLVIPDSARIEMSLVNDSSNMVLTFDGQAGMEINHGDRIRITKSPHPVHMIKVPGSEYFDILKAKLSWSGGRV